MWRDEGLDELLSHARGEVGSERFRAEIRRKHEERLGHERAEHDAVVTAPARAP